MADTTKTSRPSDEALNNLRKIFESGEFSDLTISTATKDFRVHKNIVCPASPFFQAACTRDFAEAHTGVIKLTESAETVDGMLQYIYGITPGPEITDPVELARLPFRWIDLHIAADKYDLPLYRKRMKDKLLAQFRLWRRQGSHGKCVEVGLYLYEQDLEAIDKSITECLNDTTAACLRIMVVSKEDGVWEKLRVQPVYMTAVMLSLTNLQHWNTVYTELYLKQ